MRDGGFDHHVAELFAASINKTDGKQAPRWKTACLFGTPITENECGSLTEPRDASDNTDPRLTARSPATPRGIFGK
jgi:hypothetical protein